MFLNLSQLSEAQRRTYNEAKLTAFPPVINASKVIENYWARLEMYYPEHQHILVSETEEVIGFINTLPFYFQQPLSELPEEGWDWMFGKSIADYESGIEPNQLGALQLIVRSPYQNQGYSKLILKHIKSHVQACSLKQLLIPIRPTLKHLHPHLPMQTYIEKKDGDKIYDPWIRAHVNGGAELIKVCNRSMTITGDLQFWSQILNQPITQSGDYLSKGALTPVSIDVEKRSGQYVEPNIWVKYE